MFAKDCPDPKMIAYRPAIAAGQFYPANPDSLRNAIINYLDTAHPKRFQDADIRCIVVPHAGYSYSGPVAGYTYRELKGHHYDAIIIIGPSHAEAFAGSTIYDGDAYTTPLGIAKIDKELAVEIVSNSKEISFSKVCHSATENKYEHSIEVQIPFLQVVLPDIPIVPIVMGSQDYQTVNSLMKAISSSVKKLNKNVLIVASSDLSHYHSLDTARTIDKPTSAAFFRYDYFKLEQKFFSGGLEACGGGPIVTAMMAAEQLGANFAIPMLYQTSADSKEINGDSNRVVGYFSGMITKNDRQGINLLPTLTKEDQQDLFYAMKNSVQNTITKKETANKFPFKTITLTLSQEFAAFVTIKKNNHLRGCVGHTVPDKMLINEVEETASLAATQDTRFNPVTKDELPSLDYDITILSRFKRELDTSLIQPGNDGVYIRYGISSALFLPQVATEQNWNRSALMENLCRKANLPKDTYKNPKAEIYTFKALIINEESIKNAN